MDAVDRCYPLRTLTYRRAGGAVVGLQVSRGMICQTPARVAEAPDLALLERLREVVGKQPVTETELRRLIEDTDEPVRALAAQLAASERRLSELAAAPGASLSEVAPELRRVERLRPGLEEARAMLAELDTRARELGASWLLGQSQHTLGP